MDDLKKKMQAFVCSLSEGEARNELVLAYIQMERCCRVLSGEDVGPVSMMDNGESSDLELFYRCVKVRDELAILNGLVSGKMEDGDDGEE